VKRKVDVLTVRWYERAEHAPDIVSRWFAAAWKHLPEAVPRRFGDSEPLRGRFEKAGEDGFRRAYDQADQLFFLAGSAPVHHASLAARPVRRNGPTAVHTMQAEVEPGDERVRRFALAFTHPGMIYLSASVAGGEVLDRGTLYGPAEQPDEPYLAPMGDWLGLPPHPPAWCWFGPAYAGLVRRRVEGEPVAGGLLWTGGQWADPRLHARLDEVEPSRRAARRMPRGLRRSAWSLMFGAGLTPRRSAG
jgi:hypothetical protein